MKQQKPVDQRLLDLLNGGVDGELSTAEQEALIELLADSAQAREIHEELESFTRLMAELPELEPPEYLQESVERQIRLPGQGETAVNNLGFFGNWLSANWLRTGIALAAGVVLTIGVYEMGSEPITEQDATSLVGTVVKNPGASQGELLDQVQVSNKELKGFVELRRAGDMFTLDVQLSSDEPTEFIVNFAALELEFEGITGMPEAGETVTVATGSVNVVSGGNQGYTLKLRRNGDTAIQQVAPLKLAFFTNNSLIEEVELRISHQ